MVYLTDNISYIFDLSIFCPFYIFLVVIFSIFLPFLMGALVHCNEFQCLPNNFREMTATFFSKFRYKRSSLSLINSVSIHM